MGPGFKLEPVTSGDCRQARHAYLPAAGRDVFLPLYDPLTKLLGADRARRKLFELMTAYSAGSFITGRPRLLSVFLSFYRIANARRRRYKDGPIGYRRGPGCRHGKP